MLENNITASSDDGYQWDIFIAYSVADQRTAEELRSYLHSRAQVFLATESLELGDEWDTTTAKALRESLITTVLVSAKTATAYYQRSEIAAAIALSREENRWHRVIPIFLDGSQREAPYGLQLKHGISISPETSLRMAADRVLDLLDRIPMELRPSGTGRVLTIDVPRLVSTLTPVIVEYVQLFGDDAPGRALAGLEAGSGNEIRQVIISLLQKVRADSAGHLALTQDDQARFQRGLARILQQDDPLACQIDLLKFRIDEWGRQLTAKRLEIEAALQEAETKLLGALYSEARACVEPVPDELSFGTRKKLIKAIALVGGRSFNNLSGRELETIEALLISADRHSKTSSLPVALLAALEIDYYRNHGRHGKSGITPATLRDSLRNHPLSDRELRLLKLVRISDRAITSLKF